MNGISELMWMSSTVSDAVSSCSFIYRSVSTFWAVLNQRNLLPFGGRQRRRKLAEKARQYADYLAPNNPLTPREKLVALARSEQPQVRARVAKNPDCSSGLLARLAKDPDAEVRLSVEFNPKVSSILLKLLMEDPGVDLRLDLA